MLFCCILDGAHATPARAGSVTEGARLMKTRIASRAAVRIAVLATLRAGGLVTLLAIQATIVGAQDIGARGSRTASEGAITSPLAIGQRMPARAALSPYVAPRMPSPYPSRPPAFRATTTSADALTLLPTLSPVSDGWSCENNC